MNKPIFIISALVLVVIVLTVTRVIISNNLSTTGVDLSRIDQEIDTYQRKNALLQEKTLQASAFISLGHEAEKEGYEVMSSQVVLTSPLPIAYTR